MSTSRAALATLLKIQDATLKARSSELRALQDQQQALDRAQAELHRKRQTEAAITDFSALPYVPRFLESLGQELTELSKLSAQLGQKIDAKRDEVFLSFSDKRVTQSVDQKIAALEDQIRKDIEARTQDDQSIILRGWRRARND